MEKSACIEVTGTGGIKASSSDGTDMITLATLLDIGTAFADFDDSNVALLGNLCHRFFGVEVGIGKRLVLVGEDDVHVLAHQVFEEGMALVDHIVTSQIQRDHTALLLGGAQGFLDKSVVLYQLAFDVEDVVACESLFAYVVGREVRRCTEVGAHGALAVRSDEHDTAPRHERRGEQERFDAVFDKVFTVEIADFIVTHLANKSRLTSQLGDSGDGVGRTAARDEVFADRDEAVLDMLRLLHVDEVHTAFRETDFAEVILGYLQQNVREGVA